MSTSRETFAAPLAQSLARLKERQQQQQQRRHSGEGGAKGGNSKIDLWRQTLVASGSSTSPDIDLLSSEEWVQTAQVRRLVYAGVPESLRERVWTVLSKRRPGIAGGAPTAIDGSVKTVHATLSAMATAASAQTTDAVRQDLADAGILVTASSDTETTALFCVLKAVAAYDPNASYIQGIAVIALALVNAVGEETATVILTRLVRGPLSTLYGSSAASLAGLKLLLWQINRLASKLVTSVLDNFLLQRLPLDSLFVPLLLTFFGHVMPLANVQRIIDVVLLDGADALVRVSVALLVHFKADLLVDDRDKVFSTVTKSFSAVDIDKLMETAQSLQMSEYELKLWRSQFDGNKARTPNLPCEVSIFHKGSGLHLIVLSPPTTLKFPLDLGYSRPTTALSRLLMQPPTSPLVLESSPTSPGGEGDLVDVGKIPQVHTLRDLFSLDNGPLVFRKYLEIQAVSDDPVKFFLAVSDFRSEAKLAKNSDEIIEAAEIIFEAFLTKPKSLQNLSISNSKLVTEIAGGLKKPPPGLFDAIATEVFRQLDIIHFQAFLDSALYASVVKKKTEDNTAIKAEDGDADKGKLKTTKKKLHPAPSLMVAAGQTGKPIGKSQSHHHLLDSKHDPVSPLSPTPTSPDKPSGRIVRKSVSSKNISRGKSLGPGSLHVALDIAEIDKETPKQRSKDEGDIGLGISVPLRGRGLSERKNKQDQASEDGAPPIRPSSGPLKQYSGKGQMYSEQANVWVEFDRSSTHLPPTDHMKRKRLAIATLNICKDGREPAARFPAIGEHLMNLNADIYILQEVTPSFLTTLRSFPWVRESYCLSDATGTKFDRRKYGQVIMSRLPFVELAFSQLRSRSHAMAVVGVVFLNNRRIGIAAVDLDDLESDKQLRAEQLETVINLLNDAGCQDVFIGGSFASDAKFDELVPSVASTGETSPSPNRKSYIDLWERHFASNFPLLARSGPPSPSHVNGTPIPVSPSVATKAPNASDKKAPVPFVPETKDPMMSKVLRPPASSFTDRVAMARRNKDATREVALNVYIAATSHDASGNPQTPVVSGDILARSPDAFAPANSYGFTINIRMNPLARDHFLRFPARRPDRLIMGTDDGFWGITHSLRLFANDPIPNNKEGLFPSAHFGVIAVVETNHIRNDERQPSPKGALAPPAPTAPSPASTTASTTTAPTAPTTTAAAGQSAKSDKSSRSSNAANHANGCSIQ